MKDKLKFLTKQSLDKKIKTKWFKGVNILLLILLIAISNIDRIVTFFGGDFEDNITIYVKDDIESFKLFETTFASLATNLGDSKNYQVEMLSNNIEEEKEFLKKDDNKVLVELSKDPSNYMSAKITTYDSLDTATTAVLESAINTVKQNYAVIKSGIPYEEIASITSAANIEFIKMDGDASQNKDLIAAGVILVIILPCFFLILMLVQMIGSEINDEKTTRSMEIIISNVSPKIHFLSKVLSSTLFVLIQGLLLILYSLIAMGSRILLTNGPLFGVSGTGVSDKVGDILKMVSASGVLDSLLRALPWIIVLFLFSFLLYAIVAGVLASMTTSMEDYQQLQTPIMLIIMAGYYLAIMASQFDGSLFIKIMSYFPLLSFMLSPTLYMLGQIDILSIVISSLITIICTIVTFYYGLRIYKVGILNYSSTKLWGKMFKSLKNKK